MPYALEKQNSAGENNGGTLDFDQAAQAKAEDDFFAELEYPIKKRSLSNGDSFLPKQNEEALEKEAVEKLAVTASDPDSSG